MRELTDELDARTGYRRVVGESPEWREVLTQAAQVAATDTTVLLLGESGTGKEVVARFLHRASARSQGPFVAFNCAAMPEHLLESELFGYERGRVHRRDADQAGADRAGGGRRAVPRRSRRDGAVSRRRSFCASCRSASSSGSAAAACCAPTSASSPPPTATCSKAMERGTFREDLYYRLNVFEIRLPPLRDRRDDIVPLSEAFIGGDRPHDRPAAGRACRGTRKTALIDYPWPGNVRELRNVLERAAILCDGGLITTEHLALTQAGPASEAGEPAACGPAGARHPGPSRRLGARARGGPGGARPEIGRARDDRESVGRCPLQQVEGGEVARPDACPALRPHAAPRARIVAGADEHLSPVPPSLPARTCPPTRLVPDRQLVDFGAGRRHGNLQIACSISSFQTADS